MKGQTNSYNPLRPVVVVVGYNRKHALYRLLESVENAYYFEYDGDVTLIISLDYSGTNELADCANEFNWSHGRKIVRTFETNQGLRKHLISCMDYSLEYGSAIVLEDDIVVSPYYYDYTVNALCYYLNDSRVTLIALYNQTVCDFGGRKFIPLQYGYDVYASNKNCSWGQCIIGDRWGEFKDWYADNHGELTYNMDVPSQILQWTNSWCKYFNYYVDTHHKFVIYPYVSLSTNCGDEGIHCATKDMQWQEPLLVGKCRRQWRFGPLDELPKYDDWMESLQLKELLSDKYGKNVCIDFYGARLDRESYDYCLSSVNFPYEVVDRYGLEMRPYEMNVIYNIQGDGIRIYDMHKPIRKKRDLQQLYRYVKYELRGISTFEAAFAYFYEKIFMR